MIHSDKGLVSVQGNTEDVIDDLTFAIATVFRRANCRDKKKLMNIGMNITNNAIEILYDMEKEKPTNGNMADSVSGDIGG